MKNIFIINAHEAYPFSEGKLNATLVEKAKTNLTQKGYDIKITTMKDDYDVEQELNKHQWADALILQSPVNWMEVPWSFKRYMDTVYSAGMGGQLCNGDGRSRQAPSQQYGTGGTLTNTKYMLSLTLNAPKQAFDDPNQWFFEGKGLDDLFWPMHLNFKFFGMQPMATFACFDVMKNPNIENDFIRFEAHLNQHFEPLPSV
ncbi:MAG: NAD(P)H-dependent oxidoreductase [Leptolyngbyaceae cyanobacterium MAG.088]|nr:NAD(P)H-dependent oxidoreductase [Leptolyngbyaceae cyanobacterium MAG.088]